MIYVCILNEFLFSKVIILHLVDLDSCSKFENHSNFKKGHKVTIWAPHDHLLTIWSHGHHMVKCLLGHMVTTCSHGQMITWSPHGQIMVTWSNGNQIVNMVTLGHLIVTTWSTRCYHMVTNLVTKWSPHGHHMVIFSPHSHHMVNI